MRYLNYFSFGRNSQFESIYLLLLIAMVVVITSCSNEISEHSKQVIDKEKFRRNITINPQSSLKNVSIPIKNPYTILRIHGSNTIGSSLVPHLASEYLVSLGANSIVKLIGEHENESSLQAYLPSIKKIVSIEIQAHGSSTAFKGFVDNLIDIGMSSRPIKKKEKLKLLVEHGDLSLPKNETVIGMDALSIITHPNNRIKQLTTDELAKIFSGEIDNWSYFGEPDRLISIYARDNKSGTFDTFKALVLKPYNVKLHPKTIRFESNAKLSEEVSMDVGAIGFTGMAFVKNNNVLKIGSSKSFQYIAPTNFSVNTEEYPLARRLFLYKSNSNKLNLNPYIDGFISFATSLKGQNIVALEKFISQNIYILDFDNSTFPIQYKKATQDLFRLSLNIRFGSTEDKFIFDSKSTRDLDRLADFIKKNNTQELVAIGFSGDKFYKEDPIKNLQANINRSLRLATMVNYGLRERGIRHTVVIGLGTLIPLVSDNTPTGVAKNSRVEIWVKTPI